jgi:hypothetical protein
MSCHEKKIFYKHEGFEKVEKVDRSIDEILFFGVV